MENTSEESVVKNTKAKDNGAKIIFDDPILCAQLLYCDDPYGL
ncbi:MAG: hypothetical protein ACI4S0_07455 [Dorea sp.]